MRKQKDSSGVYQLKNGTWGYRYGIVVNGSTIWRRCSKDDHGNPLLTRNQAIAEKKKSIAKDRYCIPVECKKKRITVSELWKEYCENGRYGKAYTTLRKQDSLWENHFQKRFGQRNIDDISIADINDYLAELYYVNEYSYKYVESFLKMFYLIFGQAYSRNYLDADIYSKLCINKGTKISMPKLKVDEDLDIVAFNSDETKILDEYFRGSNAETAYMLGRFCGLRINECYGLKWDHVDLEAGTIYIDRQMQRQDGLIMLVAPKTRAAKRTVYLNDQILEYLRTRYQKSITEKERMAAVINQKQRFIQDMDGSVISCTELVNCLDDGTIQTRNSMKYHSREIKRKFGIQFKYHYLRHTYGTMLANMNLPAHILKNQMGHARIQVTMQYYVANTDDSIKILKEIVNQL